MSNGTREKTMDKSTFSARLSKCWMIMPRMTSLLVGLGAWSLSILLYFSWVRMQPENRYRWDDFLRLCENPFARDLAEPILNYRLAVPAVAYVLHLPPPNRIGNSIFCSDCNSFRRILAGRQKGQFRRGLLVCHWPGANQRDGLGEFKTRICRLCNASGHCRLHDRHPSTSLCPIDPVWRIQRRADASCATLYSVLEIPPPARKQKEIFGCFYSWMLDSGRNSHLGYIAACVDCRLYRTGHHEP